MDPKLKSILRGCERDLLEKNILNLKGTIHQGVVRHTRVNWETFLTYLTDRGTLSENDVATCNLTTDAHENMVSILRQLGRKNKKVVNLIVYLYDTHNYKALECFGIIIEAPDPPEWSMDEVDDRKKQQSFPPTFKRQPPEHIRVYSGQPIKFEPCFAKRAKRYQWFKVVDGGHLLKWEIETEKTGAFEIAKAEIGHEGTYYCKAFNDYGAAVSENIKVQILDVQRPQNQPRGPVITSQPESVHGVLGEEAVFMCNAVGAGPLAYQWYSSRGALEGETRNDLRLPVHQRCEGAYFCVIADVYGNTVVSNKVHLQTQAGTPKTLETGFTATSKVALLIGNGTYRNERKLDAVYSDIPRLSFLLNQMGFKVVSCYDFTVAEMKNAVTFFASLMMEGVYAFVYFVGHGFYYQGQNYLMAADARIMAEPDTDAINIEWMLDELQKQKPAMKAIFLDICRTPPKTNIEVEPTRIKPQANKNTIVCYATGAYGRSFEIQSEDPHSFFVDCLLNALTFREPVEFVGFRIKQFMGNLFAREQLQYPELKTSLAEAYSLWDPIKYTGRTTEFNTNVLQWESANILPPPLYLNVDKISLQIHLDFEANVTNEFKVIVTMVHDNVDEVPYLAYVADNQIPQGITAKVYDVPLPDRDPRMKRTITMFKNLQKLQDELKVHLLLVSLPTHKVKVDYVLSFGKPMISVVGLWKSEEVFAGEIQSMKLRHHDQARQNKAAQHC